MEGLSGLANSGGFALQMGVRRSLFAAPSGSERGGLGNENGMGVDRIAESESMCGQVNVRGRGGAGGPGSAANPPAPHPVSNSNPRFPLPICQMRHSVTENRRGRPHVTHPAAPKFSAHSRNRNRGWAPVTPHNGRRRRGCGLRWCRRRGGGTWRAGRGPCSPGAGRAAAPCSGSTACQQPPPSLPVPGQMR